jgi:predicted glycosyltransferase
MGNVHNEGIIQKGGTMNAGAQAVGCGAQAVNYAEKSAALEEARARLDQVLKALAEQGHTIANREEVMQTTQLVKEEISKEQPNKLSVSGLLKSIAESVQSVTSIATAVEAAKIAIAALF